MRIFDVRGFLHPMGGQTLEYIVHDTDEDNDTKYFGFVSHIGSWIIMKQVESAGTFRFKAGKQNYSTNWTSRADHDYVYINEVV